MGFRSGEYFGRNRNLAPVLADGGADGFTTMAAEIVHDDDLAWLQRRNQILTHPGQEDHAVNRAIEEAWCAD